MFTRYLQRAKLRTSKAARRQKLRVGVEKLGLQPPVLNVADLVMQLLFRTSRQRVDKTEPQLQVFGTRGEYLTYSTRRCLVEFDQLIPQSWPNEQGLVRLNNVRLHSEEY
jgi:hypothetical protein